jgi:hypothetical protein
MDDAESLDNHLHILLLNHLHIKFKAEEVVHVKEMMSRKKLMKKLSMDPSW